MINEQLKNKLKIMNAINIKKYELENEPIQNESMIKHTVLNHFCSDEMLLYFTIVNNKFEVIYLKSNSCSIAEFGASILLNEIQNCQINEAKYKINLLRGVFHSSEDNIYHQKYPFIKNLKGRKNCLLMLANYLEGEINEKQTK